IVFVGCEDKIPETPENFDKDLWEDSVRVIRIIYDTYEKDNNFSVDDEDAIEEYFDIYKNRLYDNADEYELITNIQDLYKNYKTYIFSKSTFSNEEYVKQDKEKVSKCFSQLQDKFGDLVK
ncbi:MAG TPA: hypothetical protein VK982_13455, partial [Bacteroidales bacterium]|nr:hypothetical protein [Bacteroidales bacterium]